MTLSPQDTGSPAAPGVPWAAARALFDQAVALAAPARAALLADPALDPAVVAEVRSLLAHEAGDATAGFLARAPLPGGADDSAAPRTGERLGPWRIVSHLGTGGMGDVWLAERSDGAYAGRAAVKVLRRGMESAAVLARFAHEQQVLARLSHAHIAHLLDAGRTADGLPYFVMEHVAGRPIDSACEGQPLEARLALFLQLADAVAFAHRNLLVHRDLKPGNVLVTPQGQVKLLDFGIAKALDPAVVADPGRGTGPGGPGLDLTQHGTRPFTPHYASPEQVRGEPVSTATDIYSLGVLLYVLLTGQRPYARGATSAQEVARSVLEDEPTRPSALSPAPLADPQWLATRKRLRGDLDKVLLKALDKRIERRYASVDALAADVRSFLGGHPVSAQTPRPGYLLRKFAARNRVAVAAATLAVLALLGGFGASAWQAHRADLARQAAERRFEQVRLLANRLLFDYHDAIHLLPGSTAVRQRMLQDAQTHLQSLALDAAGQPALQRELGVAFRRLGELYHAQARPALGDVQTSLQLLATAQGLLQQAADAQPADEPTRYQLALVQVAQARSLRSAGNPRAALPYLQAATTLFDALAAARPGDKSYRIEQVRGQLRLAELYGAGSSAELAQRDQAQVHLQRAVELAGPVYRDLPDDADAVALYASVNNLRWLDAFGQGLVEPGLAILRGLEPVFERLLALEPDNVLHRRDAAVNFLSQGSALMRLRRWDEALAASSEALRRMQLLAAADPANTVIRRDVAKLLGDVAWSQYQRGDGVQAAALLAQSVAAFEALASHDPKDRRVARALALAHASRAEVQAAAHQPADVARHSERALAVAAQLRAATPDDVGARVLQAQVQTQTAAAYAGLPGQAAKACALNRSAVQGWQALLAAGKLVPAERPRLAQASAAAAHCAS